MRMPRNLGLIISSFLCRLQLLISLFSWSGDLRRAADPVQCTSPWLASWIIYKHVNGGECFVREIKWQSPCKHVHCTGGSGSSLSTNSTWQSSSTDFGTSLPMLMMHERCNYGWDWQWFCGWFQSYLYYHSHYKSESWHGEVEGHCPGEDESPQVSLALGHSFEVPLGAKVKALAATASIESSQHLSGGNADYSDCSICCGRWEHLQWLSGSWKHECDWCWPQVRAQLTS